MRELRKPFCIRLLAALVVICGFAGGAFAAPASPSNTQELHTATTDRARPSHRASIDLDGNGTSAIVLRNSVPQMQALRLVGNQFQASALSDPGPGYRLLAIADLDGNGKSDLIFQDTTQAEPADVHVWTDFQSASDHILRKVKLAWLAQATGDLDGDGFGDLVFRYTGDDGTPNDTGVSYIWFTDGAHVSQVRKRGGAPLSWTLLGAADLNGDGAADMIYLSPANQIRALMATPSRTCANFLVGDLPVGFKALQLADFTGNHRGDVLLLNAASGAVQLLSIDATGVALPPYTGAPDDQNASCSAGTSPITTTIQSLPATGTGWQYWTAGDFNGDGLTDIVWKRPDGTLTVWLLNRNGAAPTVIDNAGTAPAGYSVFPPPPTTYTLTVTLAGPSSGTVTSSPVALSCGASCISTFSNGTTVTLKAVPIIASVFLGWGGDCSGVGDCVLTMNGDHNVTANFWFL